MLALFVAMCAVGALATTGSAPADEWVEAGPSFPLGPATSGPLLVALVATPALDAEQPTSPLSPPSLPPSFHCLVRHWSLLLPGVTALSQSADGLAPLLPALLDHAPSSRMPTAPTLWLYAAETPSCDAVNWFSLPASALADDTVLPALRAALFAPPASPARCNATCVFACEGGRCRVLAPAQPAPASPPPPLPPQHASLSLLGGGQHRQLAVAVHGPRLAPGWVLVALPLPPGAFVDEDELAGLERAARLCRDPTPPNPPCDIEAPSYEARPCPALLALPTEGGALEPIPLHIRYHAPVAADRPAAVAVTLPSPALYHLAAPDASADGGSTSCAAFHALRRRGQALAVAQLRVGTDPLVALMPVGRKEDGWPTLAGTAVAVLVAVATLVAQSGPADVPAQ